jgi:hypothetical protein
MPYMVQKNLCETLCLLCALCGIVFSRQKGPRLRSATWKPASRLRSTALKTGVGVKFLMFFRLVFSGLKDIDALADIHAGFAEIDDTDSF